MNRKLWLFGLAIVAGCGSSVSVSSPATLVSTPAGTPEPAASLPATEPSTEAQAALEELIARDAEFAAAQLREFLDSTDPDMAALAAVYVLRLNIHRDNEKTARALQVGIRSKDPLIACLSWRWLAVLPEVNVTGQKKYLDEPLVHLFAALAHAARGKKLPVPLAAALAVSHRFDPGDIVDGTTTADLEKLRWMTSAVDDSALALAIAFHEARRNGSLETVHNAAPRPLALRYRNELLSFLGLDGISIENDIAPDHFAESRIRRRLLPTVSLPLADLRRLCVDSSGSLQHEALLSLGLAALSPLSGDFAAARAGMESDEPRNRLEAARTYLLLTARATKRTL